MKNYVFLLFILLCLTFSNCSTSSKISKQSSQKNQKELACKNLVWYNFINGKPNRFYLEGSKKVAERWGFKIVYGLGSCTNNEEDKKEDSISKEKSIPLFKCLTENYGENWKSKFREEVKTEIQK